ncbi:flagellar hook-length control protein FliK [Desulfobacterium sp. N47]|uniref:flagellar hook-length control protein FliK n=1 Tax=Desulfobacterium sp. N47 TaxID=3115210 RepID=UPI003CBD28C4
MMQNVMLAGSILKFLNGICTGSTDQPVVNGSSDFKTIINKSMKNSLKTDLSGNAAQTKIFNHIKNDKQVYLEALRKGLLAKGKSLDKIYLKDSDIHTISLFLNQCGYNKIEANQCIDKLLGNNPDGKIKLSDFFAEIETHLSSSASVTSGKKSYRSVDLEPSVIPQIDSALKDLGLNLKDADNILNASRSPSGGLDLNKLIVHLKTMENRINKGSDNTEEKVSAEKFIEKHQELGLQITPDKETGQISINGFIAALEQFRDGVSGKTQGKDSQDQKDHNRHNRVDADTADSKDNSRFKGNIAKVDNSADKLPSDVQASIDGIIERAVAPDEKFKLNLNDPSLSQIQAEALKTREKTNDTTHIFQGNNVAESVKKAGNRTTNYNNENARNNDSAKQENLNRISDQLSSYNKDSNPEKESTDLKLKSTDILQEQNPSVKFETLSSILQSRSDNSFMPAYTVEQLGKQISRSVARGDRIINLHLTPPELGSVKLSMEIKDSILHLKIVAESSSAKEVLLNNSHDLKTVLADQGIKLERLDIRVESNSGNALTDLNKGFNQEHRQYQETGGGLFSDGDMKEDISSGVLSRAAKDYLVDLTA